MFNVIKKFRERKLKLYLNKALSHINAIDERKAAIRHLARLHHKDAVAPLMKIALDKYSGVQVEAAEALGKLGDQTAIETLTKLLVCKSGEVRRAAAESLVKLGEQKWSRFVMGDSQDFIRLGKSGEKVAAELLLESAEPLIGALASKDFKTQSAAAKALGELGVKRAVLPLINILPFAPAAEALGKLGDERALEPLIEALEKSSKANQSVRGVFAEALGRLGDASAIPVLEKNLGCGDAHVRQIVSESLAKLGDRKWQKWVMGDDDDFGRLGASHEPRAFGPLIYALDQVAWDKRPLVICALGRFDDERAVEPLIKVLLGHRPGLTRERLKYGATAAAAEALGKLGDERAIGPLTQTLAVTGVGERRVRKAAVEALVNLSQSCPALVAGKWQEIKNFAKVPHTDSHRDHNPPSDCHGDKHSDSGIGVDLPEKPPGKLHDF